MCAWKNSIYENNAAQEVLERWEEWINGTKSIGYEKAIDRYFKYWGDAIEYGDPITNNEIIALLGLHLENAISIPKKLKDSAVIAISIELEQGALESWSDSESRKAMLLDLLKEVGEKPKKVIKKSFFKDPSLEYRSSSNAKKDLLLKAKKIRKIIGSDYLVPSKGLPPFLDTLDRYMNHRVWEKDYNIANQAKIERCMMLSWYVAMRTGMSLEKLEELLDFIINSDNN